jgi:hypothetical protein
MAVFPARFASGEPTAYYTQHSQTHYFASEREIWLGFIHLLNETRRYWIELKAKGMTP